MMRQISTALLLTLAALPGCGGILDPDPMCTAMGCTSQLRVELTGAVSAYEAVAPVTVELCFDTSLCADYELREGGTCTALHEGDPPPTHPTCYVNGNIVTLRIDLTGTSYSTSSSYDVSVTVRDQADTVLFDESQGVTLDSNAPNGSDCGPVCYDGTVTFETT